MTYFDHRWDCHVVFKVQIFYISKQLKNNAGKQFELRRQKRRKVNTQTNRKVAPKPITKKYDSENFSQKGKQTPRAQH